MRMIGSIHLKPRKFSRKIEEEFDVPHLLLLVWKKSIFLQTLIENFSC